MKLDREPPPPTTIMLGCAPWNGADGGRSIEVDGRYEAEPVRDCPVCKGTPLSDERFCARCEAMSPRRERQLAALREQADAENHRRVAEKVAAAAEVTDAGPVLSERDRREIWNGTDEFRRELPPDTFIAEIGREFLRRVNQCPDWSVVLDRRGNAAEEDAA